MESAFDLIVVTAANRAQARGYRAQLRGRANVRVVPDPGDRRVGSLGATVNVLRTHFAHPNAQTPKHPNAQTSQRPNTQTRQAVVQREARAGGPAGAD